MKTVMSIMLLVSVFVRTVDAQQSEVFDKEKFLQMVQAGILARLTPEQIRQRIKEAGMTEEEAIRMAKERGVRLDDYIQQVRVDTTRGTKIEIGQPDAAGIEVKVPVTSSDAKPTTAVIPPDITPVPKGPGGLEYFGYDIFKQIPAAFEPTAVGPVDPEYLIGPEDVLRVTVWGQVEFQNELVVDREGRIFIPTIGQVLVSGLTLEKAYEKLKRQMSRSYSGLLSQPPTVWLDVTLARLRPKRIFIMGEVKNPGGYTVSSYATVFSSLYSVGGPTVRGSLRDIRVLRGNKIIATIDLYDYLTGAEQTNDIRVQSNDIIFVPVRGKTVAITGAVRRPAIYELKEKEQLQSLLIHASGLLPTAYAEKAQIERVRPLSERTGNVLEDRIVIDIDLRELLKDPKKDLTLFDADLVRVPSILDEMENYVTIQGAVWRPGRYELGKVKTLRDLITVAEGLQPKAHLGEAHLTRLNEDRITRQIIPIDLGKLMEGKEEDRNLLPRDEITIYSTEAIEVKEKFVTIRGEVKNPGRFPYRNNMTLEDLILAAGGYTEEADTAVAEVSRVVPGGLRGDSLAIILRPKLPRTFAAAARKGLSPQGHPDANADGQFLLQHRDEVLVLPNPRFKLQQNVVLEGELMHPGTYTIKHRLERLAEMIDRAGGPTKNAYLGGAEFYRGGQRLLLDFEKAYYQRDQLHNVILSPGDRIVIPRIPHTVLVTGEVNKPGLLSFIKGKRVSDYLERAGEVTDSASYALLTYPTGETRKVNFGIFRKDPEVLDGSTIVVLKEPPEPPGEKVDIGGTIKDVFAIMSSAATLVFIVWQVTR